jgi:hypothetical protein
MDLIWDYKSYEKENWENFFINNKKKNTNKLNMNVIFYEKNVNITVKEISVNVKFFFI